MRKSKKAYMNYVCPYCWHTLNKCTCKIFPPYHLTFIDENIQEHVRILNEKNYRTIGCCEGHRTVCINTYVAFGRDYFENIPMPEGFKYNKKRRIISYTYSTKLTKEEMEELKAKKLSVLLEWCKSLPDRNIEK